MKPIEILIVEDNPKAAKVHQVFVERLKGFTVCGIATNLQEARELVKLLEPDLLLLDVYFPEGNGIDFLREIQLEYSGFDVIMITAATEVQILRSALRGGVFDYLIKPVMFDRFEEALKHYQQHRRQLADVTHVSQHDADRFFNPISESAVGSGQRSVPKGIDQVTLDKFVLYYTQHPETNLTAEEIGAHIGTSRTTARKYMEFLVARGFLKVDLTYGTIGRPERRYSRA